MSTYPLRAWAGECSLKSFANNCSIGPGFQSVAADCEPWPMDARFLNSARLPRRTCFCVG